MHFNKTIHFPPIYYPNVILFVINYILLFVDNTIHVLLSRIQVVIQNSKANIWLQCSEKKYKDISESGHQVLTFQLSKLQALGATTPSNLLKIYATSLVKTLPSSIKNNKVFFYFNHFLFILFFKQLFMLIKNLCQKT